MTTTLNQVSPRALPAYVRSRDDGCGLFTSCLACPLPKCRDDDPHFQEREDRQCRDAAIIAVHRKGLPVTAVATRFGVSTRTVYRVLQGRRKRKAVLA